MTPNLYALLMPPGHRDRRALLLADGTSWTYADLDRQAGLYAAVLLGAGLRPGNRVAVQVEKSPQALALYLGCLRAGLCYVPVNTAYQAEEARHIFTDAEPGIVVTTPDRAEMIGNLGAARLLTLDAAGGGSLAALATEVEPAPVADVPASATAILMYTSGTTGRPKGAMQSHGGLSTNATALSRLWQFSGDDVLLHCLPLVHAHGLTVSSHCALLSGATMIWLPRFDAGGVLEWLRRSTVFMGVPTMYSRLLAAPELDRDACANVRLFTSGSAPLSPEMLQAFEQRTGHRILERYGMTETGINASNPLRGERKAGSVGKPLPGVDIRVIDGHGMPLGPMQEGEVQVRGSSLFSGYWHNEGATAEAIGTDGWFRTGDIGRFDEDGYLFLMSRSKDIIITGGYNVYPPEVEAAVEQIEGVAEAAVIGVPHPDFGEGVIGVVVVDAHGSFSEADAIACLKTRLANYKVPKRLVTVGTLPRNAIGKVMKPELRERFRHLLSVGP